MVPFFQGAFFVGEDTANLLRFVSIDCTMDLRNAGAEKEKRCYREKNNRNDSIHIGEYR